MRKAVVTFTCDRCGEEWVYTTTLNTFQNRLPIPINFYRDKEGKEIFIKQVKLPSGTKELCPTCWQTLEDF